MYKILSVGGSIIIPPEGFNVSFLKKFTDLIVAQVKKGDKFVLVVGGGSTCRQYQSALKKSRQVSNIELDWLGIYTTWYNAEFVRMLFGNLAYKEVIKDPTKKIRTNKPIIIAGGWKPGCSTDYDAVLLAKNFGAREVINLSNINYVYTADPKKDKTAKSIKNLTWSEMRKIVGDKWVPGKNMPFDPKAVRMAQKLSLKVVFVKGINLSAVKDCLSGITKGTVIQ